MTREEFKLRIGRLRDAYERNYYSDQILDVLWSRIKNKSAVDFNRVIDNLLLSEKQAPTPNKILTEFYSIERQNNIGDDEKKIPCDICDGSGTVSRMTPIRGTEYSCMYRCTCENAKGKSEHILVCPDRLLKNKR